MPTGQPSCRVSARLHDAQPKEKRKRNAGCGRAQWVVRRSPTTYLCLMANSSRLRLKVASCSAMTSACTACTCSPSALY